MMMRVAVLCAAVALLCGASAAKEECSETRPMQYQTAYSHAVNHIRAQIQSPAPAFTTDAVVNGDVSKISLSDYRGKYTVLVFFPLAWTFVCPTELYAFNDRLDEFKAIDTEVIALSVDSVYTLLAWTKTPRTEGGLGDIDIPLAADLTHEISKNYGVLLEDVGHTLRGLFIIDSDGILRQVTMNDLPVGRSVDETLRLVKAFKHTDTHDVVCPANWQPGSDTIVPNPTDKLDYFKNQ